MEVSVSLQASSSTLATACGTVRWRSRPEKTKSTPPPTNDITRAWTRASVASMMIFTHPPLSHGEPPGAAQGWVHPHPHRQNLSGNLKIVAGPWPIMALLRKTPGIPRDWLWSFPWMYCLCLLPGGRDELCECMKVCVCVSQGVCSCLHVYTLYVRICVCRTLGLDGGRFYWWLTWIKFMIPKIWPRDHSWHMGQIHENWDIV